MGFYTSISKYYQYIFPFNPVQVDFIRRSLSENKNQSLLDIGCGTGSLSFELSGLFRKVTAIDLDEAMLKAANRKFHESIKKPLFQQLDMLNIQKEYGPNAFDAVVCFGNTLVHLKGPDQILDFFHQSRSVLKKDGKLLFQIINYDRIIDQQINGLPTIENDNIKFIRNYHYHDNRNIVDFETILTIKETDEKIENTIQLYPLRKFEINELLSKAGFSKNLFYRNFKREALNENSIPLIVESC